MLVREIMSSPVVTISSASDTAHAAETLRCHGFTALPVLDVDGRLIGIVSEADLLDGRVRADDRRRRPEQPQHPRPGNTVREVMSSPVESLTPGADVADAVQIMLEERIRCLPACRRRPQRGRCDHPPGSAPGDRLSFGAMGAVRRCCRGCWPAIQHPVAGDEGSAGSAHRAGPGRAAERGNQRLGRATVGRARPGRPVGRGALRSHKGVNHLHSANCRPRLELRFPSDRIPARLLSYLDLGVGRFAPTTMAFRCHAWTRALPARRGGSGSTTGRGPSGSFGMPDAATERGRCSGPIRARPGSGWNRRAQQVVDLARAANSHAGRRAVDLAG